MCSAFASTVFRGRTDVTCDMVSFLVLLLEEEQKLQIKKGNKKGQESECHPTKFASNNVWYGATVHDKDSARPQQPKNAISQRVDEFLQDFESIF